MSQTCQLPHIFVRNICEFLDKSIPDKDKTDAFVNEIKILRAFSKFDDPKQQIQFMLNQYEKEIKRNVDFDLAKKVYEDFYKLDENSNFECSFAKNFWKIAYIPMKSLENCNKYSKLQEGNLKNKTKSCKKTQNVSLTDIIVDENDDRLWLEVIKPNTVANNSNPGKTMFSNFAFDNAFKGIASKKRYCGLQHPSNIEKCLSFSQMRQLSLMYMLLKTDNVLKENSKYYLGCLELIKQGGILDPSYKKVSQADKIVCYILLLLCLTFISLFIATAVGTLGLGIAGIIGFLLAAVLIAAMMGLMQCFASKKGGGGDDEYKCYVFDNFNKMIEYIPNKSELFGVLKKEIEAIEGDTINIAAMLLSLFSKSNEIDKEDYENFFKMFGFSDDDNVSIASIVKNKMRFSAKIVFNRMFCSSNKTNKTYAQVYEEFSESQRKFEGLVFKKTMILKEINTFIIDKSDSFISECIKNLKELIPTDTPISYGSGYTITLYNNLKDEQLFGAFRCLLSDINNRSTAFSLIDNTKFNVKGEIITINYDVSYYGVLSLKTCEFNDNDYDSLDNKRNTIRNYGVISRNKSYVNMIELMVEAIKKTKGNPYKDWYNRFENDNSKKDDETEPMRPSYVERTDQKIKSDIMETLELTVSSCVNKPTWQSIMYSTNDPPKNPNIGVAEQRCMILVKITNDGKRYAKLAVRNNDGFTDIVTVPNDKVPYKVWQIFESPFIQSGDCESSSANKLLVKVNRDNIKDDNYEITLSRNVLGGKRKSNKKTGNNPRRPKIFTGPKGGKYYLKNGSKVYVR